MTARRPAAVTAVLLVLASLLGAHLAAVLLLTAVCLALAVLAFAIADVVAESGWRTVPGCAVSSTWREA